MSEPTRYRVANNQAQLTLGGNILAVDPAGPLVTYADYARLKAEVERLYTGIPPEGSNDAVGRAVNVLLEKEKEIARLKAEVERLRKAGDALALEVIYFVGDYDPVGSESLRNWNAAKEGKV